MVAAPAAEAEAVLNVSKALAAVPADLDLTNAASSSDGGSSDSTLYNAIGAGCGAAFALLGERAYTVAEPAVLTSHADSNLDHKEQTD